MLDASVCPSASTATPPAVVGVSLVVPCYNERAAIDQLMARLAAARSAFADRFEFELIFVDDGSTDGTAELIEAALGTACDGRLVRHGHNRGVAAAIHSGILAASHEIVVSIDSDCTYDPLGLDRLVEVLLQDHTAAVALVTASPYHPQGDVVGVPAWRLSLSKVASQLYRLRTGLPLHTFTSCFRAYRRSRFLGMQLSQGGFVGVAEMLCEAAAQGGLIAEVPATLHTRRVGYSKLRTLPVIRGHLAYLRRSQSKGWRRPR